MKNILEALMQIVGEGNVRTNEPMSLHTTFKIGGPADYFALPSEYEQVAKLVTYCKHEKIPYFIVGNGSNLLVSDAGFRGVIIQIFNNMQSIRIEGVTIKADAGVLLSRLAAGIREESLAGFEFASGIPGALGGAVTMNAGAYGGEMKDILVSATVLDDTGAVRTLRAEEMEYGYRTSIVKRRGWIVLGAELALEHGDRDEINARTAELTERRVSKQPLTFPSAGSTFKRPEGYFAGKLIMDSGLRGYAIGGAQVSEKHCGFVINRGGATADDVLKLIHHIQSVVSEKFGVSLEPEVRFLGFSEDELQGILQ